MIDPNVPPTYAKDTNADFSLSGTHFDTIGLRAGKETASSKP